MGELSQQEYNNDPVFFCKHCLSLRVRNVDGQDYCDECGSTDIMVDSIEEWENIYIAKYGHKYISNNGRDDEKVGGKN